MHLCVWDLKSKAKVERGIPIIQRTKPLEPSDGRWRRLEKLEKSRKKEKNKDDDEFNECEARNEILNYEWR